jgi:galactose mutarotase-like enzyme
MKTTKTAAPFRLTLLSTSENKRVETAEIIGRKITPKSPRWTVHKLTLHGGKQEGVDVVVVNNGKLSFTIVPTRGMSILNAACGGVSLGWNSPVKEVVHPRHVNLSGRGGLGWLEGFNEWLVRCGLENIGGPVTDKFINDSGGPVSVDLTLHGKIGNIPASEVEVVVERAAPHRITIRGRVDERTMFGPQLELRTEISTVPGSTELRITDTITNRGGTAQEFQLLYHANYGAPLLEAGAVLLAPVAQVTPHTEHAAKAVKTYANFAGPTKGFSEEVYCLDPRADEQGRTMIALANARRDRAVSMAYAVAELPCLTLWKNTASEAEGYVAGLEPGTSFPNNRSIERKLGRVPKLASGASLTATIDYAVHVGTKAVQRVTDRIQAIQGRKRPVIQQRPEQKD